MINIMAADGISNHDIDLVEPSWFGPRTLMVKQMNSECEI